MNRGFTLSELLIALAILGVIATFTIPKVLQSQQDGRYKAIAKEAAATISSAYELYKMKNQVTASTGPEDLTPFINYLKTDTSGATIDNVPGNGTYACLGDCIRLHNGAVLAFWTGNSAPFGGTATTNAIWFTLDPDGTASTYKAEDFYLYTTGRIKTTGTLDNNTCNAALGCQNADTAKDPPWFSWN